MLNRTQLHTKSFLNCACISNLVSPLALTSQLLKTGSISLILGKDMQNQVHLIVNAKVAAILLCNEYRVGVQWSNEPYQGDWFWSRAIVLKGL